MKILFMRHGESVDDLTDQFGGWADLPLTPKGNKQIKDTVQKIKDLNVKFSRLFASPLLRAQDSARIVANELSLPLETFLYLKEKNGNGLLTGLNRQEAMETYPELVEAFQSGYVYGAEPHEKFIERVKVAVDRLLQTSEENIIAVTHGGFMSILFNEILNLKYEKAHDGGFVLLKGDTIDNLEIEAVNGIDYN